MSEVENQNEVTETETETTTENSGRGSHMKGRKLSKKQKALMLEGRKAASALNASLPVLVAPKAKAADLKPIGKIPLRKTALGNIQEYIETVLAANPHMRDGKVVKGTLKLFA